MTGVKIIERDGARYRITIEQDQFADDPNKSSYWRVHSFNHRHVHFTDPDEQDEYEIKKMIESGRAYWLDYSEHGNCRWSLQGRQAMPDFDSVGKAGLLEYTASDTPTKEEAEQFINLYTQWCNGEVYSVTVECLKTCPTCNHEDVDGDSRWTHGDVYADDIEDATTDAIDAVTQ